MGKMKNSFKILVGKPGPKRILGRPRSRRDDNIRTDFTVVDCEDVDWIHLAEDRYY
jgi:hypothetical protein